MPFLHKFASPLFRSRSSRSPSRDSTPSSKNVAYSPVSQSDQVQLQTKTQTHKPDSYFGKPNPASTVQELETQTQAQFIYEDINPPTGLEHLASTQVLPQSLSTSQLSSTISLHSQTPTGPDPTMLSETTSTTLPPYNDVSGSVVVDTEGYPRFLTPDEQQERESTLQKAVHERMMGLPRRTEFTWEVQGGPVLPRYEGPGSTLAQSVGEGAEVGVGGGEKR
ncbi:uncharacterized protein BDV14DRAFT_200686 [Aspergillus stella-maris]|uniref:uncharacterized protein n=1 Tax=Aspergillus stella-maris TaxID=1810926 RepID=UPI003CCE25A8